MNRIEVPLREIDPEIYSAIQSEKRRQETGLEMIASENFTYDAVLEAPVRYSRTNMRKAIQAGGTTEAVNMPTSWRALRLNAQKNSSARSMPMCSRTPAVRPTCRCT